MMTGDQWCHLVLCAGEIGGVRLGDSRVGWVCMREGLGQGLIDGKTMQLAPWSVEALYPGRDTNDNHIVVLVRLNYNGKYN